MPLDRAAELGFLAKDLLRNGAILKPAKGFPCHVHTLSVWSKSGQANLYVIGQVASQTVLEDHRTKGI